MVERTISLHRISIHASAREATCLANDYKADRQISIHASAREATASGTLLQNMQQFQSTPPRGRRLKTSVITFYNFDFNPRLREGGDTNIRTLDEPLYIFQSTPPRGRRLKAVCAEANIDDISIHASAREATKLAVRSMEWQRFQSTPPRGRRRADY